jgi:Fe-S oxidoreductase/FAD/FMN-containing dehydrogenase
MIAKKEKQELVNLFGERVAFNLVERVLHSNDVGALPELARQQLNTYPDAVVQPENNNELKALIELAVKYRAPLVPRGSGTSGYGGTIPTRGGIVVDFYRLNHIFDISKERKTVTVESGVTWNDLEKKLRSHGLALRLYPGSAISATVGGWVANGGGAGIGSFEYGYIGDNILEVELMTTKGLMKLTKPRINLVEGMAGTTGLIYLVKLLVRDSEDDIPILAALPSLRDLTDVFQEIKEKNLPLWEASYRNPLYVKLNEEAIEKQSKRLPRYSDAIKPKLPQDKYIGAFVYPCSRGSKVRDGIFKIVKSHSGEMLNEELSKFDWEDRFYPLRLKALGPSIIPSEVCVPTDKLRELIGQVSKNKKPIAFYGSLINNGTKTVLLTYTLDDERRRGFPLAYATSLSMIKAASKLGGSPYAIGMYFTDYTKLLLDKEKLSKIYKFKKEADPEQIMNPGKIFPRYLDKSSPFRLNLMLRIAKNLSGLFGVMDKLFGGKSPGEVIDNNTTLGKLPFGKEVAWDALTCANCGYCRTKCPEFNAIGWESSSPRGKFHILRDYLKGKSYLDERIAELFYVCTTCGHCNKICQVKSHIEEDWTLAGRPLMWQEGFNPPMISQVAASNILVKHNPSGYPHDKRTAWVPPGVRYKTEGEIAYWVGCAASYDKASRNLSVNSLRILNKAGIEPTYLNTNEWCCGGGTYLVGCLEDIQETVRHNIEEVSKRGIKTIITSCGSCYYYFAHLYPILAKKLNLEYYAKIKHITEVISELIDDGKIKLKFPININITYHDPCHIAIAGGIVEAPRKILSSIPGLKLVEMPRNRKNTACCGRHTLRYPRLGRIIIEERINEANETGAQAIVAACPTCGNNFRTGLAQKGDGLEVFDITDLVAESMGLPSLVSIKLNRLLRNQPERVKKESPKVYLTDEELKREKNLFRPHEPSYAPLKTRQNNIRALSEKANDEDSTIEIPKSC